MQILPIHPVPNEYLGHKGHINITHAWAQLTSGAISEHEARKLEEMSLPFEEYCKASHSPHAEVQLVMFYETSPDLAPSYSYFGCSKKSCLLCCSFLRGLPTAISTRGEHGICYPAWGVPQPVPSAIKTALTSLERALVARIRSLLTCPARAHRTHFTSPVQQSTLVSSISESYKESERRRADWLRHAKEVEIARINERRIR